MSHAFFLQLLESLATPPVLLKPPVHLTTISTADSAGPTLNVLGEVHLSTTVYTPDLASRTELVPYLVISNLGHELILGRGGFFAFCDSLSNSTGQCTYRRGQLLDGTVELLVNKIRQLTMEQETEPLLLARGTTLRPYSVNVVRVRSDLPQRARALQQPGAVLFADTIPLSRSDVNGEHLPAYMPPHLMPMTANSAELPGVYLATIVNPTCAAYHLRAGIVVGRSRVRAEPHRMVSTMSTTTVRVPKSEPTSDLTVSSVQALGALETPPPVSTDVPNESPVPLSPEERVHFREELEKCDVGEILTKAQRNDLFALLEEYFDVFGESSRHRTTLPTAKDVKFVIKTDGHAPIKQKPYRHPPSKRAIINKTVDNLLGQDLIEVSTSPWASPVIVVFKKDDPDGRMCMDYRQLNAHTIKDSYPIPRTEDCLNRCRGAKWMTSLDLVSAFFHIPIESESRPFTAFVTEDGLWQWKRMPFGPTNGPSTFQRYIDSCMAGLTCAVAFFDDINACTDGSFEDHLVDLRKVLGRLRANGLTLKLKKCHFAKNELKFLGHLLRKGTILPDPAKTDAVRKFPPPRNIRSLRTFLGLSNYYRRFIEHFAYLARPLYVLLKKGQPFMWQRAQESAFGELKQKLLTAPCLYPPDFRRRFCLQTDASDVGIGAVLKQDYEDGEHPVAYLSRQYLEAETHYAATEKEALAIVWAIHELRHYLADCSFDVVTDHSALVWMPRMTSTNARVQRWAIQLSSYHFTVYHRKGSANANADALSRAPLPAPADTKTFADPLPPRRKQLPTSIFVGEADETLREARAKHNPTVPQGNHLPCIISVCSHRAAPLRRVSAMNAPMEESKETEADHVVMTSPPEEEGGTTTSPTASSSFADAAMTFSPEVLATMAKLQREDRDFADVIHYLERHEFPAHLADSARHQLLSHSAHFVLLETVSGQSPLLYYVYNPTQSARHPPRDLLLALALPVQYRTDTLALFHATPQSGHYGVKRTLGRLVERYWWPRMYEDVATYVRNCEHCCYFKSQRELAHRRGQLPHPPYPFHTIAIDYATFPRSGDFEHLLIIVDLFTHWVIAVPVIRADAETTARVLWRYVICQHGCPRVIISDNGTGFRSRVIRGLTFLACSRHYFSSTNNPRGNSVAERGVGSIKSSLETFIALGESAWSYYVDPVVFAYNTGPHSSTGITPFEALYGRIAVLPAEWDTGTDAMLSDADIDPTSMGPELVRRLTKVHEHIRARNREAKVANDAVNNRRVAPWPAFQPGDLVYLRNADKGRPAKSKGRTIHLHYAGPYIVRSRVATSNYRIAPYDREQKKVIGAEFLVHVARLQPCGAQPSDQSTIRPHNLDTPMPRLSSDEVVAETMPPTSQPAPVPSTSDSQSTVDCNVDEASPVARRRRQENRDLYNRTPTPERAVASAPPKPKKAARPLPPASVSRADGRLRRQDRKNYSETALTRDEVDYSALACSLPHRHTDVATWPPPVSLRALISQP
jgi:hypothetical protein